MAYIEFTAGSYAGQRRDLNSESITIGRNPEAHILLDDLASSSNHAELRFHGSLVAFRPWQCERHRA